MTLRRGSYRFLISTLIGHITIQMTFANVVISYNGGNTDTVSMSTEVTVTNGFGNAETGQCTGCAIGYFIYRNETIETTVDGLTSSIIQGLSCSPCQPGSFSGDNSSVECDLCSEGTSQMEPATGYCEPCKPGSYTNEKGRSFCQPCAPGQFQQNSGMSICNLCESGFYSVHYGSVNCTACLLGQYSRKGAKMCRPCPAGTYGVFDENGVARCRPCDRIDGQLATSDVIGAVSEQQADCKTLNTVIIDCPVQAYLQCVEGEYLTNCGGRNPGVCLNCTTELCMENTISYGCTRTNPGCCSIVGNPPCEPPVLSLTEETRLFNNFTYLEWLISNRFCAEGMYRRNISLWYDIESACTQCPIGTFKERASLATSCTSCPVGSFGNNSLGNYTKPISLEIACVFCPPDTYSEPTNQPAALNQSFACQVCTPGTFLTPNASFERIGTFSAMCIQCPLHTFGNITGAVDFESGCISCPNGTYSDNANKPGLINQTESCQVCPHGTSLNMEGIMIGSLEEMCILCPVGTFGTVDKDDGTPSLVCTLCPPGTYSLNTNRLGMTNMTEACQVCPVGRFLDVSTSKIGNFHDMCPPCPLRTFGTMSDGKPSLICTQCPSDTYSSSDNALGLTDPDKACQSCLLGTTLNLTGSMIGTFQEKCPPCLQGTFGTVVSEQNGRLVCTSCPFGTYSLSDNPLGLTDLTEACQVCPHGTYLDQIGSTVGTIEEKCPYCPQRTFSTMIDGKPSLVCTQCPSGTYSMESINPGATNEDTACQLCSVGTSLLQTATMIGTTAVMCPKCPVGTFGVSNETSDTSVQCTQCPPGTFSLRSNLLGLTEQTRACQICPNGTTLHPEKRIGGFVGLEIEVCVACEQGKYFVSGAPGTYVGTCVPCFENSNTVASMSIGIDSCLCNPGWMSDINNHLCIQRDVQTCEWLQRQDDEWSECIWCLPFEVPSTDKKTCRTLDTTEYEWIDNENANACTQHEVTYTHPFNMEISKYQLECVSCPFMAAPYENSLQYAGVDAVFVEPSQCSEGCRPGTYIQYSDNPMDLYDYSCISCTKGTFSSTFGAIECTPCPPGSSTQRLNEATRCEPSPAGYSQPFEGMYGTEGQVICLPGTTSSAGAVVCTTCGVGTYNTATLEVCHNCPAGTFSDITGRSTECEDCISGTTSPEAATECIPCGPGTYNTGVDNVCTQCLPGTFSAGLGRSTVCTDCDAGTISEASATTCTPCEKGEYNLKVSNVCELCEAGKYSNEKGRGIDCVGCDAGATSSEGATTCILCTAGKYNLKDSNVCELCEAGKYSNDTGRGIDCVSCDAGATSSEGATTCILCTAGTYNLKPDNFCTNCPSGTFSDQRGRGTTCTPCAHGSVSEEAATECNKCAVGTFTNGADNTCNLCFPGTQNSEPGRSSECEPCAEGSISLEGASICTQCAAGSYNTKSNELLANTCIPCSGGTFSPEPGWSTACNICEAGTTSPRNSSFCTQCPAGTFNTKEDGTTQNECTTCLAGSFGSAAGRSQACELCPSGSISSQGASFCTKCPVGSYNEGFSNECTICRAGKFSADEGRGFACDTCANGTISVDNSTVCTPCAAGKFHVLSFNYCEDCPMGTYSTSSGQSGACTQCSSGTETYGPGATSCTDCTPGTYNTIPGETCKECLAGTYSPDYAWNTDCLVCSGLNVSNYTNQWACLEVCVAGTIPSVSRTSCVACAAGSFGHEGICVECPIGTAQSTAGKAHQCQSCNLTSNEYQNIPGQAECKICDTGPSTLLDCLVCEAGTYFLPEDRKCFPCPIGTAQALSGQQECHECTPSLTAPVSLQLGAVQCTSCPQGFYAQNTSFCAPCRAGLFGYSNQCLPCPADTFSTVVGAIDNSVCKQCAYGKTTSGQIGATEENTANESTPICSFCPAGKFLEILTNTSSVCMDCPPGSFSKDEGSVDVCTPCPRGHFSPYPGAAACQTCLAGTIANTTGVINCIQCPDGFSDDGRDMEKCIECPAGYAAIDFECLPCSRNTTSLRGSMQCSECPIMTPENDRGVVTNNICSCPPGMITDNSKPNWCQRIVTVTPAPSETNDDDMFTISIEILFAISEEEFRAISEKVVNIIANIAQVPFDTVSVVYVRPVESTSVRRLLTASVSVGFEIQIGREASGSESSANRAQSIARLFTSERISRAISEDSELSVLLSRGAVISAVQITLKVEDPVILPIASIALVAACIFILCVCCCAFVGIVHCCHKKPVDKRVNNWSYNTGPYNGYRALSAYTSMRNPQVDTNLVPVQSVRIYSIPTTTFHPGRGHYDSIPQRKIIHCKMDLSTY